MRALISAVVGIMLAASGMAPASAADLRADVSKAPFTGLSASLKGDFDGDGRLDDVVFSAEDGDRQAVYMRLGGGEEVKVISLDARLAAQVQRAPAATYQVDCGSFADHCGGDIKTQTDGLILSLDEGVTVLVHWNGEAFDQDFVRSDEVRLSRAVATLFAFNP